MTDVFKDAAICNLCEHSIRKTNNPYSYHFNFTLACTTEEEPIIDYVLGRTKYNIDKLPLCRDINKDGKCKNFKKEEIEYEEPVELAFEDYDQIRLKCVECGVEMIVIQKKPE